MTLTPISLPSVLTSPFSSVTSSFLLPEVCRDWQRGWQDAGKHAVTQTDPSPSPMRSAGPRSSRANQADAPRRLTQLQAWDAGGDEHGCLPEPEPPAAAHLEAEWRGPVRELLLISSQELSPESFESPWKPHSLCLLPALRCWIWTSQYEINTPSPDAALLAVPGKGWFYWRCTDLEESFSHSLRSISTGSSLYWRGQWG